MTPRCKPGDLAVVVAAPYTREMLGRFVIVERQAVHGEILDGFPIAIGAAAGVVWVVRSAVSGTKMPVTLLNGAVGYALERGFRDSFLRPIRPNEGEDESLSWSRPRVEEAA